MSSKNDAEQDGHRSHVSESGPDLPCFDPHNGERSSTASLGEPEHNTQTEISSAEVFDDGGRNMLPREEHSAQLVVEQSFKSPPPDVSKSSAVEISSDPGPSVNASDPHPERDYPEEWNRAKQRKDCKTLISLMQEEGFSIKICETSWDRTALHVAAMQGCFPLARRILDAMAKLANDHLRKKGHPVVLADESVFSMASNHLSWGFMGEVLWLETFRDYVKWKDKESGLSAFEMANDIIGNRSISQYINHVIHGHEPDMDHVFYEAYPLTSWYRCLLQRDCDILVSYLDSNPRLLFEKAHGMTVLHVAILEDSSELVEDILALFGSERKIEWGEEYYPSSLTLEDMLKPHPSIKLDDKFWKEERILGRDHVGVKLKKAVHLQADAIAMARLLGASCADQLQRACSHDIGVNAFNHQSKFATDYVNLLLPTVELFCNAFWQTQWNVGFDEDVDFNFETKSRCSLLRLHYACKNLPLSYKFLLEAMQKVGPSNLDLGLFSVYDVHDAQGRTPISILVHQYDMDDNSNLQSIIDMIPTLILSSNEDARGRNLFEHILINNYIPCTNINLYYLFLHKLCSVEDLQIALLSMQSHFVEFFLKNISMCKNIRKWRKNIPSPLIIAAATGNHESLSLLLEHGFDPMIVDDERRSTLHFAANPTLFRYPQLMLHRCCSTLDMFCSVRKKLLMNWEMINNVSYDVSIDGKPTKENLEMRELKMKGLERLNAGRKACILMLLQKGVDLSQCDMYNKVPNLGPTEDANYQSWWYDLVVNDTTDKKKSFNEAGNALSVVGILVAATSYIGPLQPPMNYTDGFVNISEKLVKVFMWSNTLAFYLAVASVMFAVVPSLPMPQEGVMSELNRARHMVSFSLCLLLAAIGLIMISFTAASMVVVQDGHSFERRDLLFAPSIIGWFFCFIAIIGFVIRLMRLIFYNNRIIRQIYNFSIINLCKSILRRIPNSLE